jgi:hypothetical protein
MLDGMRRISLGLLVGALGAAFAWETLSVLSYGLGLYGPSVLQLGLVVGLISGALVGPVLGFCRTDWRPACVWTGATCALAYLGIEVGQMLAAQSSFESPQQALRFFGQGTAFVLLAGALSGGLIAAALERLQAMEAVRAPRVHPAAPAAAERRLVL